MIYLPDVADAVPPVAERCPDPQEPSGRCRFSGACDADRQRRQQRVLRMTGATCPWYVGMAQAKAMEAE